MPARLDILVQRNEAFTATIHVADDDTGTPIDLTDHAAAMQIREKTSSTLVQTATVEITDAAAGEITFTIDASTGNPLHSYGAALYTYDLAYDLVLTDPDNMPTALLAGYVTLSRGVTTP